MLWFLFLFGLALGAETPADDPPVKMERGNCPAFWFNFNGRCYQYVSTPLTWADAEFHCVSQGANLVSIHSLEEQNFVKSLVNYVDPMGMQTWIGLSDLHREGSWMWSDGYPVNFFDWAEGEPNIMDGWQNCVNINSGAYQKWGDEHCSIHFPSVCATRISCTQ